MLDKILVTEIWREYGASLLLLQQRLTDTLNAADQKMLENNTALSADLKLITDVVAKLQSGNCNPKDYQPLFSENKFAQLYQKHTSFLTDFRLRRKFYQFNTSMRYEVGYVSPKTQFRKDYKQDFRALNRRIGFTFLGSVTGLALLGAAIGALMVIFVFPIPVLSIVAAAAVGASIGAFCAAAITAATLYYYRPKSDKIDAVTIEKPGTFSSSYQVVLQYADDRKIKVPLKTLTSVEVKSFMEKEKDEDLKSEVDQAYFLENVTTFRINHLVNSSEPIFNISCIGADKNERILEMNKEDLQRIPISKIENYKNYKEQIEESSHSSFGLR